MDSATPGTPGNKDLELITCVVQRGRADKVAKAAIDAGAGGATVLFARGMGLRERLGLLGLAIVPEKEVIMIVSEKANTGKVFAAIVKAAKLEVPGMGIAYVSPITAVAGLVNVPSAELDAQRLTD
jgi:nitrogen regulatory protein P-II 1